MIISAEESLKLIDKDRSNKHRIVFTNGCFDILHIGHARYLADAKTLGDRLVVGINSDKSTRELKGLDRPVNCELDRAELLLSLKSVDYVIIFDELDPVRLIKEVKPDFLVKGGDWSIDQILGGDFVMSYGGKVLSLPFIQGRSTTNIINKIRAI